MWFSLAGAWEDINLAFYHESVHRALTPRFFLLRQFRANLSMSGYKNIVLLKWLEEACAETFAQARVFGFKGLIRGIRFPFNGSYGSIVDGVAEGYVLGTIVVGSQRLTVSLVSGAPSNWSSDSGIYLKTGIEQLYGWWWVTVGQFFWCYYFDPDKRVRWYDPYNHKHGDGRWTESNEFVQINWSSGIQEKWPLEINTSNEVGTYIDKGTTTKVTAKRVWDTYISNLTGRWKQSCDKWLWFIDFSSNGTVRWTDFYNSTLNGRGRWHLTPQGAYVMWDSGSKDDWALSPDGSASGKCSMKDGTFSFTASKSSA